MNLSKMSEESAARLGERRQYLFNGKYYTNIQFLTAARRLQGHLMELGMKKGDVAILCFENDPVAFPVFQGIFRTGGIAIPLMHKLTAKEIRYILTDCKAMGIFTDVANLKKIREAICGVQSIKWIIVTNGKGDETCPVPDYELNRLMTSGPEKQYVATEPGDVVLMLYTAGTTGKPKGVMLTNRSLVHVATASTMSYELERHQAPRITVTALPLAHIFGIATMLRGFLTPDHLADSCLIMMPWFETEQFMKLIQQYRANLAIVVPTMINLILRHPKVNDYDLSSLEEVVSGSAPIPVQQMRAFAELVGISKVRELYGCTECAGLATRTLDSEPFVPGSVGKPYHGVSIKIVDDMGNELPAGVKGEVTVKGPCVMKGYLNRPQETAEAIRNGWLHTGDIGYMDNDGYVFICDRKKDMIIRGGENIYPAELEEHLYQHGSIAEAAVVGVPDEIYGEKIIAYVVRKPGNNPSEQELIDFMKRRVTSFKAPSRFVFIDEIPKNAVGKILKTKLRDYEIS